MAKAETPSTRLPRGTKPVTQAFFAALENVPEAQRATVAKAAQSAIRDELKARKLKAGVARAKARDGGRAPARATPAPRAARMPIAVKPARAAGRRPKV